MSKRPKTRPTTPHKVRTDLVDQQDLGSTLECMEARSDLVALGLTQSGKVVVHRFTDDFLRTWAGEETRIKLEHWEKGALYFSSMQRMADGYVIVEGQTGLVNHPSFSRAVDLVISTFFDLDVSDIFFASPERYPKVWVSSSSPGSLNGQWRKLGYKHPRLLPAGAGLIVSRQDKLFYHAPEQGCSPANGVWYQALQTCDGQPITYISRMRQGSLLEVSTACNQQCWTTPSDRSEVIQRLASDEVESLDLKYINDNEIERQYLEHGSSAIHQERVLRLTIAFERNLTTGHTTTVTLVMAYEIAAESGDVDEQQLVEQLAAGTGTNS